MMYTITKLLKGGYLCSVRIQDGSERWEVLTREKAVTDVIKAARTLNGSYIREDDIAFNEQEPRRGRALTEDEAKLLDDIRRGEKKLLDHDNPLIKYRITPEECELLLKIREGDLVVTTP